MTDSNCPQSAKGGRKGAREVIQTSVKIAAYLKLGCSLLVELFMFEGDSAKPDSRRVMAKI